MPRSVGWIAQVLLFYSVPKLCYLRLYIAAVAIMKRWCMQLHRHEEQKCSALQRCLSFSVPFPFPCTPPSQWQCYPTVQRQQNSKFVYVVKKTQNCLTLCRDCVKRITFLHFKHSLQTTNRLVAWIHISSLPLNPLHIFSSPSLLPKIKGLHSEFLKLCSSMSLH